MYESNIQPSKMQFIETWKNYNYIYIHMHTYMHVICIFILDKRQKHQKDLSNVSKAHAMTEN